MGRVTSRMRLAALRASSEEVLPAWAIRMTPSDRRDRMTASVT
jgi:hypothetical protein